MKPYLDFESGDSQNVRGRALLVIYNSGIKLSKLVDINTTALKEALHEEILRGRLVSTEVFEPFFLQMRDYNNPATDDEWKLFAKKEGRDLIVHEIAPDESHLLPEAILEQIVARYMTLCRENIYIRLLHQMGNDLFSKKRQYKGCKYYITLFKIAGTISCIIRATRENDRMEVAHYCERLTGFQQEIPFLQLEYIKKVLLSGNGRKAQEMADYVDIFFLSLKKDFPCSYNQDVYFSIEKAKDWMEEEWPVLLYNYFHALFAEDYKKAQTLKQKIDHYALCALKETC
jgi:hypothetical protein